MLSASEELALYNIKVDGEVGRQFSTGVDVVRQLKDDGLLPYRVIVHLGTNGYVSQSDINSMVYLVGPNRKLYFVTVFVPRPWQDVVNKALRKSAAELGDNIGLIKWFPSANAHPEWFYPDGYHPNPVGQVAYAKLIRDGIRLADNS